MSTENPKFRPAQTFDRTSVEIAAYPVLSLVRRQFGARLLVLESLDELPPEWVPIGSNPTDDAQLVINSSLATAIAWVPSPKRLGDSLEALMHELGHMFGFKIPGELLAREEAAIRWEVDQIRGLELDLDEPGNRALVKAVARVAGPVEERPDERRWIKRMLALP